MKCHYEVLQIEQDASEDDIRKSYRRLALKWHPDKNLNNSEEAKEQFQLIQQAYEILSDQQERSWYDRHRDSILKGGLGSDYKDDSLNVYQYFTTTCFKGYGNDEKGFYAVYSEVFNKIGAEDSEFNTNSDSEFEIPVFGNSKSSYEEVVHPFYSYWQSYSTKKSYSWLDKYDIRDAPNRRVLRLMEKENKKIRDKARKERNEEVRALVAFVRKRDKRVQEYALFLEKKAIENERKIKELRKTQIIKRKEELSSYVECEWAKFSNLEGELKEIEETVAAEFDDVESNSTVSNSEDDCNGIPHCLACNKLFKTDKAFLNHEKSKKHKENLERLEALMKMEDAKMNSAVDSIEILEDGATRNESKSDLEQLDEFSSDEEHMPKPRKKKKSKKLNVTIVDSDIEHIDEESQPMNVLKSEESDDDKSWDKRNSRNKNDKKKQKALKNNNDLVNKKVIPSVSTEIQNEKQQKCAVCDTTFSSKNELFKHLKSSGHSVPLTDKICESTKSRQRRKK